METISRALWRAAFFVSVIALLLVAFPAFSQGDPPAKPPTGDEIMAKVRQNEYSESVDSTIKMTLVDKTGRTQTRSLRIQRMGDNVLIRFMDPPDIKDTGYLLVASDKGDSQIFVYLPPPTDDVREINVEEKNSSQTFLGSDFDLTDFQVKDPKDTENTYLRTETIAGIECHVVQSVSRDPDYKYSKVLTWIRTDYWLPIKAEFYDKEGNMAKEMKVYKYRAEGERRVISKSEMTNKASNHKTVLELEEIKFDVTFPDDNFTIRRLKQP